MPTTRDKGNTEMRGRGQDNNEEKGRAHYPDHRTLSGEPGIKPGPAPGHRFGMAAVLTTLQGIQFPASKDDIINEFGQDKIEWYKGEPETIEDIMNDVEQDHFINMADLVHAIGDVVMSASDRRLEYRKRRSERGDSGQDFENREYSRSRGQRGSGQEEPGGGGFDEETGTPVTRSGHIDRRTREGQDIERQERGYSSHEQGSRRGGSRSNRSSNDDEDERAEYERLRAKFGES